MSETRLHQNTDDKRLGGRLKQTTSKSLADFPHKTRLHSSLESGRKFFNVLLICRRRSSKLLVMSRLLILSTERRQRFPQRRQKIPREHRTLGYRDRRQSREFDRVYRPIAEILAVRPGQKLKAQLDQKRRDRNSTAALLILSLILSSSSMRLTTSAKALKTRRPALA